MNIVFLLITYLFNEPNLIVVGIVYFIASFSVIYSTIFLLLFLIHLQRESFSIISQLILLFFYGLISVILLIFPGGIDIGEHANWIPRYSLEFLILSYIYLTVAVIIPIFYFLIKIYSTFKDKPLKKKFIFFSLGIVFMLITIYGLVLYNTWQDPIFRTLWSVISLIVIPSGLLIYYGIAQNL
jgi:hypothetical protein